MKPYNQSSYPDHEDDGPNPWIVVAVLLAIAASVILGILFTKYLINQL